MERSNTTPRNCPYISTKGSSPGKNQETYNKNHTIMKQILQLDNSVHPNQRKERQKALAALDKAKKIQKPIVVLTPGFS